MPEHIDVDFMGKIVTADSFEEIGPLVIELKVVNVRIFAKEPAVIGRDITVDVTLVDACKEIEKILPFGISYTMKRRTLFPCLFK